MVTDDHLCRFERVGLCYWGGKVPTYLKQIVKRNAKFFDKLIILLDGEGLESDENLNLEVVNVNSSYDILHAIPYLSYNEKIAVSEMRYAAISDFVCYFAPEIIYNLVNISVSRVMYFDMNTVLFNQFLINEVFSFNHYPYKQGMRRFITNKGVYSHNNYADYISTDICICDSLILDHHPEFLEKLKSTIALGNKYYTQFGPGFLMKNLQYIKSSFEILNIDSYGFDTQLLHEGWNVISPATNSFGVEFSNTLDKSAGYHMEFAVVLFNKCFCYFKRL